jgi:GT2 family glycosyltransferase
LNLSIVIVSYNVKDFLSACLHSIQNNFAEYEIIVVDNNSVDGTIEMVKKEFPSVKIIANKENTGFSGANNQGIEIAQSENIFLLNPDTVIINNALTKLLERLKQNNQLAIIGPRLLNSDMTLQFSCWRFPGIFKIFLELFYLHKLTGTGNYSQEKMQSTFHPDVVSGAAMLFKKELVDHIGGLDENLFWMEDTDFCYRAKKAGAIVEYFPEAEIIHHIGKSSGSNYRAVIANQLLSKLKYMRKHSNGFVYLVGYTLIFIHIISRIIVLFLIAPFAPKYRAKLSSYFYSLQNYFKFIGGRNEIIR